MYKIDKPNENEYLVVRSLFVLNTDSPGHSQRREGVMEKSASTIAKNEEKRRYDYSQCEYMLYILFEWRF